MPPVTRPLKQRTTSPCSHSWARRAAPRPRPAGNRARFLCGRGHHTNAIARSRSGVRTSSSFPICDSASATVCSSDCFITPRTRVGSAHLFGDVAPAVDLARGALRVRPDQEVQAERTGVIVTPADPCAAHVVPADPEQQRPNLRIRYLCSATTGSAVDSLSAAWLAGGAAAMAAPTRQAMWRARCVNDMSLSA